MNEDNEINLGKTTTVKTMSGGASTSIRYPGSRRRVRIDPDVDVYVKASASDAMTGIELTDDTDGYRRVASIASASEFNFPASTDITLEFWGYLDPSHVNEHFLSVGNSGSESIDWYLETDGSGYITTRVQMTVAGSSVFSSPGPTFLTSAVTTAANTLYHIVHTLNRSTGEQKLYVNGALEDTQSPTDSGAQVNVAASGGTFNLGTTIGGVARWGGTIVDLKIYHSLLSITDVQNRTNRGPVTEQSELYPDVDTISNLKFWLCAGHVDQWASATYPEATIGNIVTTAVVGSPSIGAITDGAPASPDDSPRVLAGLPAVVRVDGDYLNLYTKPGANGKVYITEV